MFALFYVATRIQLSQPRLGTMIGMASSSLVFLGVGIAQLRSGYLWRNVCPGNRGVHRSKAPFRFILSCTFDFILALVIIGYALWSYTHAHESATPPSE